MSELGFELTIPGTPIRHATYCATEPGTHARTHKTSEKKINMKNDMKHGTLNIFVISLIFKLIVRLGYSIKMVMSPNGPLLVIRYNRLSLSRIPRDSLKHFEISVPRDVRAAEVRKTIN